VAWGGEIILKKKSPPLPFNKEKWSLSLHHKRIGGLLSCGGLGNIHRKSGRGSYESGYFGEIRFSS